MSTSIQLVGVLVLWYGSGEMTTELVELEQCVETESIVRLAPLRTSPGADVPEAEGELAKKFTSDYLTRNRIIGATCIRPDSTP